MSFDPISALFDVGKTVVERVWPDPIRRAVEIRKLEELRLGGDIEKLKMGVQLLTGQMEINKIEASHKSIFVAGWRPAIGWVGAAALFYQFIAYPLLLWLWQIADAVLEVPVGVVPPVLGETEALYTIILGMLGIGAMRSYDKRNGVETNSLSK